MEGNRKLHGYPLTINIYAESEEEVEDCRKAVIAFIGQHASQCRAVTARKVANAIRSWDKNLLIRNQIISYFK